MRRIGIFGGTFDPIHNGHLQIAEKAAAEFKLEEIIFIPTGIPPHKTHKISSKLDRHNLTRLAVSKFAGFKISKIEINSPGYSYAVDTFQKLKKKYGPGSRLFYILGLDSINDLQSWKKPFLLFKYCDFIVATRPKSSLRIFKRMMKFPPLRLNSDKIHLLETNISISSTQVREKAAKNKSLKKLVPKNVEKYIIEHNLYKS